MGWTHCFDGIRKPNGEIDRRRECDKIFTWVSRDERWNVRCGCRVLKSAMVGSVYYAAVERYNNYTGFRDVGAAVCLTCGRTRWDGTAWGYKDMDETMGPYYYDCPVSILNLLSPTDNQTANEWREECRRHAAKARERRRAAKVGFHPFVPHGITVENRRGSWIIGSLGYVRYRFSKRSWHDFDRAMVAFLRQCGTPAQQAEYAATGRDCPDEWKGKAA